MIVDRKHVTHDGRKYLVSRTEYNDRIVYQAWEAASRDKNGFLTGGTHGHVYEDGDKKLWGNIEQRVWPPEIEQQTPRSEERVENEKRFRAAGDKLIDALIYAAFKVKPPYVVKRDKPIDLKEEKMEAVATSRSPVKPDTDKEKHNEVIKKILAVADFARLKQLAKLNDIIVKEKDTAGLLKMRIMNAFRSKLVKGEVIAEA